MYLISQLWSYLTLAFLLGALVGYLLWRACGRKRLETLFDRSRKDMTSRLTHLEDERAKFASVAVDSEAGSSKLKTELANVRSHDEAMAAAAEKALREAHAAKQTLEADKAAAKAREDKLAVDLAAARKHAEDEARKHADDLKKTRDQVAAELAAKHADEVKKARDLSAELVAKHAAELKIAHETAKKHETQVLALSQSDSKTKVDMDAAKVRHEAELKKAREDVATEAARKHAEDLKKARDHVTAELTAKHAEEVKKAREHAAAEAATRHAEALKKARDEATAEAAKRHAEELAKVRLSVADDAAEKNTEEVRKAREHAATELAKHAAELKVAQEASKKHETQVLALTQSDSKARADMDAAKARHDAELKTAREDVAAEAARKHGDELKKAREQAAAEAAARHADDLKKAREHLAAELTTKHAEDVKKALEHAAAEAAARHADEIKKAREHAAAEVAKHAADAKSAQELARKHETQVLALTDQGGKARAELDAAKARHDAELKKARDDAMAEAARKHAEELARARTTLLQEAEKKHADELAKVKAASAAEFAAHKAAAAAKPVVPAPATFAPAAPAHPGPERLSEARGGKPDDLKLIWGVGPEIEKLLNKHGIYHFEQIANWSGKDLDWLDANLHGFEGRAEREKWVEQAAKLATGWRPEREIGDKPTNLLKTAKDGKPDDLKLIWGVGPKLEQMLNTHGIWHFSQIAAWTGRELEWVDSQLGTFAGRAVRDKWIEQSAKLASGWRPENEVGDKPE